MLKIFFDKKIRFVILQKKDTIKNEVFQLWDLIWRLVDKRIEFNWINFTINELY